MLEGLSLIMNANYQLQWMHYSSPAYTKAVLNFAVHALVI